jgi:hypothetical protein
MLSRSSSAFLEMLGHVQGLQMGAECGDAFPFFHDHDRIVPNGVLRGQPATGVDHHAVFDAALFRPNLRHQRPEQRQQFRRVAP